jgi:hypothetical protein
MDNLKRWYIHVSAFISLQGVAWAVIALLRNLLIGGINQLAVAGQIAVIIVGLPVFLGHWLWGQRLAASEPAERNSLARWLYLYGTLTAFLLPFLFNAYDLLRQLFRTSTAEWADYSYQRLTRGDAILYHLVALLVLAALWFYHQRLTAGEVREAAREEGPGTLRRLYIYLFSASGLGMVTIALIHLIRWVMSQFGADLNITNSLYVGLKDEFIRLLIGLPLWIIFWRAARQLYGKAGSQGERDPDEVGSALRRFYLNGTIFVAVMSVVVNATGILASLLRQMLRLAPQGDIRQPLPIILGAAILWVYHYTILREEAAESTNDEQAGVLRLYRYLTAWVGFAALLIGLGGVLSVIIEESFERGLRFGDTREALAWSLAGVIAGLIVWIIPFRAAQAQATAEGPAGAEARRSLARRIYMYFFLFLGVLVVLSAGIFVVFRVLVMIMNIDSVSISEIAYALGFSLIAMGSWLLHGGWLRADRRRVRAESLKEVEALRITLLDFAPGKFGSALANALKEKIEGLQLTPLLVDEPAPEGMPPLAETLAQAGLIVAPWDAALPASAGGRAPAGVAEALGGSPARKLLVPLEREGWDWAGVSVKNDADLIRQAADAVRSVIEGEKLRKRKIGCGGWVAIIIGIFILLNLVGPLFDMFF